MMWFLVLKYCSGCDSSRWLREQAQGEAEAGQEVIVVIGGEAMRSLSGKMALQWRIQTYYMCLDFFFQQL